MSVPARGLDYASALALFEAARSRDAALLNPDCLPRLLTHGSPTAHAVVLIHGFTNCPQMWSRFGRQLFEEGSNVLIPRLPRHGYADRLTDAPARLTDAELRDCADEAAQIASGLGARVTVAGLSLGAVLAAHLAASSDLLDRAVLIAPLFAAPGMPVPVSDALGFAAERLLPNRFVWWDRRLKAAIPGPRHAYPRFATRGYGAMLQLGSDIRTLARLRAPRVRDLRVVINAADPAVNNDATLGLVKAWRARGAEVGVYSFARELGLLHDLVDPDQSAQRIDFVYPVLRDQVMSGTDVG